MHETRVIAGLGNPGKNYELTRHNLGFLVVEVLAEKLGWEFRESKEFNSRVAKGKIAENTVYLLLPQTYMNESGRAVRQFLNFYKIPPSSLVVVADDVAIPFGETRLRRMGSSGGHNGLKSIELHLGTRDYPRLRMGVGSEFTNMSLADHVLSGFTADELSRLPDFVKKGATALERLMTESIAHVMNSNNVSHAKDLTSSGEQNGTKQAKPL